MKVPREDSPSNTYKHAHLPSTQHENVLYGHYFKIKNANAKTNQADTQGIPHLPPSACEAMTDGGSPYRRLTLEPSNEKNQTNNGTPPLPLLYFYFYKVVYFLAYITFCKICPYIGL